MFYSKSLKFHQSVAILLFNPSKRILHVYGEPKRFEQDWKMACDIVYEAKLPLQIFHTCKRIASLEEGGFIQFRDIRQPSDYQVFVGVEWAYMNYSDIRNAGTPEQVDYAEAMYQRLVRS